MLLVTLLSLPSGAWADSGVTISEEKTWVFDNLSSTSFQSGAIEAQGFYVRASSTATTCGEESTTATLTFADGYSVANTKYYLSFPSAGGVNVTASSKAWDATSSNYNMFSLSANQAGTVYVKIQANAASKSHRIYFADGTNVTNVQFTSTSSIDEIAFTSTAAGHFFIGTTDAAYKIYGVRFVPSSVEREIVNSAKTWTFNDYSLIGAGSVVYIGDGLYLRGYVDKNNVNTSARTFTIESGSSTINSSYFGGEFDGTISKVAVTHAGIENPDENTKTASQINSNKGTPTVSFNTSVAGTCYAAMGQASSSTTGTARIYFGDGTTAPSNSSGTGQVSMTSADAVYYPYLTTTTGGTFMIGAASTTAKIYAVRFVPSVYAPTYSRTGNTVTITAGTCNIDGATLSTYYTTDGSEPTNSTVTSFIGTSGTVEVPSGGVTIKAITYATKDATTVYGAVATSDTYTFDGSIGYNITYELNGGTVSGNPESYTAATETFTLTNPTKDGCTFAGWTGTDLSEATTTVTIEKGSTGAREYTATWTPKAGYEWNANTTTEVSSYTTLTQVGDVWVHAHTDGHAVNLGGSTNSSTNGTYSNGTAYTVKEYLELPGAVGTSADRSVDQIANAMGSRRRANDVLNLNEFLAIDVAQAGTLFVIYRPNSNTSDRNVYLGFQDENKNYSKTTKSASLGTDFTEIKQHCDGAGTFFLYASLQFKAYSLMFVPDGTSYALTATPNPSKGGTISWTYADNPTTATKFASGSQVVLTPTAETGYAFSKWTDGDGNNLTGEGVSISDNVLTLTMSGTKTVKAVFDETESINAPTFSITDNVVTITGGTSDKEGTIVTYYKESTSPTASALPTSAEELATWTEMTTGNNPVTKTTPGYIHAFSKNSTTGNTSAVSVSDLVIYGTYDFKAFAQSEGVLTDKNPVAVAATDGDFTDRNLTVNGHTMALNGVFSISAGDNNISEVKLRKNEDASTGLFISNNRDVVLTVNNLKAGDWIKVMSSENALSFKDNGAYSLDSKAVELSGAAMISNTFYVKEGNGDLTLKYGNASTQSYIYSIEIGCSDKVPAPTINDYDKTSGKVTITGYASTKGSVVSKIFYTTDGSDPSDATNTNRNEYPTGGITIEDNCTIKAYTITANDLTSSVVSKDIVVEEFTGLDISNTGTSVTIASATSSAGNEVETYYTLDGSTPSKTNGTKYDGTFTLDQTRIVKAITISSSGKASEVVTKKIVVDAATPATTWDFTKMTSIAYSDDATTIYYKGGSGSDFKYIIGSDIHAKMTWQSGDGTGTLAGDTDNKYLTGTKPFSINDLAVGDKIYITYEGGSLKVFKNASKGNSLTIGVTEITGESEQTFDSGAEITVTAVDANDNYISLRQATATAKITKIEINPVYQITGVKGTGISTLEIKTPSEKTFDDSFARGTEVTLKATTTLTGGAYTWTDGDGNVLTPATSDDEGELTFTLTDNMTINVSYSTAKIWDFSEMSGDDITTVTESKGLYYRGGADNRKISIAANTSSLTWNFPDGFTYTSAPKNLTLKGNGDIELANDLTPSSEADNKSNLTLAFTTTEAGTVYVAYRVASGKNAKLYFKSASGESYEVVETNKGDDNNNRQGILYYTAKSAGNFFIGGDGDLNIYLVKFEPASADIFTLTQTASPEGSGSVKKEIIYGDTNTPSYYETQANDFLAGTQLRLTPAANVGYGFSYWGDTNTDLAESKTVTMNADQSVKVNFNEVKHTVTVAAVENGTVALQVGGETVTLTEGKAAIGEGAEVTVMTTPTLFYGLSSIVVTKTGDTDTTVPVTNGKFTLPEYDVTVTVTFAAEKKYNNPTAKTWTFADAAETINSIVDYGDGLYLRGSASNQFTKVSSGTVSSVTFGDENISVSNALQTTKTFTAPDAGNTSATAISPINGGSGLPMIAVNADVVGTLYVAASPVADGDGQIRIYFSDGTTVPTEVPRTSIPSASTVYTASSANTGKGTFYIGTTCAANIYAVKFVPTVSYDVTVPTSVAHGSISADKAKATEGETVTLTVNPEEGYSVMSLTVKNGTENIAVTTVAPNSKYTFVMPAAAPTITISFKEIASVYGTYDFRTWAESHISANDQSALVLDASGVMTGEFTPSTTEVTIDGTMTLNDVFSIVGSKTENIAGYKLRKNGTNGDAGSGLLIPRCSVGQSDFIIGNLNAGDWFTVNTHTNHLVFAEANESVCPLGSETPIAASEELVPGRVYKVKDTATSLVSVKICNSMSGGGTSYIYSVTISNAEAISEPSISDLTDAKVTITGGSSTIGGSVKTYYTIDGSTPSATNGTEYTSAVEIEQTRIVKAVTINTATNVVSNVVTKKITVDAATPSTIWDFVNDSELNPLTYADDNYNGYYINSAGASKGDGKFKYVTNEKIHSKLSWQLEGTETANASVGSNGLSITKGGRAFAINDLHVRDKIYITYTNTGDTPLKTSINADHGCSISVNGGETVSSGNTTEIASGDEIEIKATPEGYEYLVLMPADNKITIQKIEINPAFTLTNATTDENISNVKFRLKGETSSTDLGESKIIASGTEVTLTAIYTAVEGKTLIWQDGDGNEYASNSDGTLTLTMDADKTVKALLNEGLTVTQIKDSENKEIARKVSNGLLEVTFNNNGRITEITDIKTGKKVINQDAENQMGYFNFNYRPSKTASVTDAGLICNTSGSIVQVGKTGSDQVELIYPMADAATPSNQTWKIGYVMKKGVSGIYAYAILDGSSSYSELHEARFGWRVNPDIFNYAWVSDTQKGAMPTPTQMKNPTETVQDATFKLSDGSIYTKYDWANFVKDDQLHGIMGDGIGAWLISPSTEWVNGGPTKQELTVHATDTTPIILQTLHSSHFGAGEAVLTGSDDKKIFGPALFYVNSGSTQDAMVADAKSMASAEVEAWPYSWFTNNADIKSGLVSVASERGTVSGTVNIDERFGTNKVQVVLTQGTEKPLLDNNGYQYYTEATVGSNFQIKNIRPGTYQLYVYALNGGATGTYTKGNVSVGTGTTDLGAIEWDTDGVNKVLWRIGDADRTTKGFKLSDEKRHYGVWETVPETLNYTIGTNTESDWYYAQVKNEGIWNIKFNYTGSANAMLRLTIATAGASQTPKLEVKMNDNSLSSSSIVFNNDAAIYRSGVMGGRDSLIVLKVPATYMNQGENTLSLKVWNLGSKIGGVMYDCIKLEEMISEASVSKTTNWTFGEMTAGTAYKEVTAINDEYYLRASKATNRNFTVKESAAQTLTFADGSSVTASNYLEANGKLVTKVTTDNDAVITGANTAGDATNAGTPSFAFNATKAGTVYAKISSKTADKLLRIYFTNGTTAVNTGSTFRPSTTDITEISYTSTEAGTFFICGAEAEFNIYAVRFVPTDEAVTYNLNMGAVQNGTIKAIVGTDTISAGSTSKVIPGAALTLVAIPDAGYQLSGWKDGSNAALSDLPQSVSTTTVMPIKDLTVSATFVAQPETPTAITASKTWTFDSFTPETRLSGSTVYEYDGLYISGHRSDYANQATVKEGAASNSLGGTAIEVAKYLSLAGGQDGNLAATRTVNSFTQDAVALKTATTGTLYVLMAGTVPTEGDRYFNIYVNGTKHQTKIAGTEPAVVSQVIADEEANIFIATSGGQDNIYAIRFAPANVETVEIEGGSEFVAIIEDGKAELADVNITEETTTITISGKVDGAPVTTIAENAFTEENSEGLKTVDLSETQIALTGDVRAEGGILAALPEETLVYLPATSSEATGTNVIIKESDGTFTCEDFQIYDKKSIEIPEGKEFKATDAKLNRQFTSSTKCTVCLPYDFPATGGKFFEFTGINLGKVQMTERTGTLKSNTPYIFEPESDATAISAHSDTGSLEISISDAPETKNDAYHFTFKGTYEDLKWDTTQDDVVIYGFAAEAKGSASIGQFVRGGAGASILPFRAYMEYSGTSRLTGARTRGSDNTPDYLEIEWIYASIEGDGGTTGIYNVEKSASDDVIYNLRGQRVDENYKGLIIKNGKVTVRK